jgi:hypothetical protein
VVTTPPGPFLYRIRFKKEGHRRETAAQLSFDIEPRTDGESGQSVSYSNPTFDKRCVRVVIAKSDEWLLETSGCVGGHKKALSKSTCDLQHNPSINIH